MHLRVEGLVQGVCFRYYTQAEAEALGLSGWVRNRPDGSVEIIAEGETQALKQLREWCSHGPPHARVKTVKCEFLQTNEHFSSFTISG